MGRTQSAILPSAPVAANASEAPSGDSTGGPPKSPVRLIVVFAGGSITVRVLCTGCGGRLINIPAIPPSAIAATTAAAQPKRSRVFEDEAGGGNAATAGDDRSAAMNCSS